MHATRFHADGAPRDSLGLALLDPTLLPNLCVMGQTKSERCPHSSLSAWKQPRASWPVQRSRQQRRRHDGARRCTPRVQAKTRRATGLHGFAPAACCYFTNANRWQLFSSHSASSISRGSIKSIDLQGPCTLRAADATVQDALPTTPGDSWRRAWTMAVHVCAGNRLFIDGAMCARPLLPSPPPASCECRWFSLLVADCRLEYCMAARWH